MDKNTLHVIRGVALVAIWTACIPSGAHAQLKQVSELASKVQAEKKEFSATDALNIHFTLTNKSDKTLSVLKWLSPLEGFNANIFHVKKDGQPVRYIGRTVKRGVPQAEDYVTIAAGESVATVVDLSQAYAIYDAGDYSVEYTSRLLDFGTATPAELAAKRALEPKQISTNVVSFKLVDKRERPQITPADLKEEAGAKQPSFTGCSQSQQSTISAAHSNAQHYSGRSWIDLALARPSRCPRYVWWFGTYDPSRWDTVKSHFSAIHNAFANQTVTYDCTTCNLSNAYAYVYANRPFEIYLCNYFWSAPAAGTDSQFGTLIHEMSHFYVVAGTNDYVYGQTGAHNLAVNNPSEAVDNADNHEYFAENPDRRKCGGVCTGCAILVIPLVSFLYGLLRFRQNVVS